MKRSMILAALLLAGGCGTSADSAPGAQAGKASPKAARPGGVPVAGPVAPPIPKPATSPVVALRPGVTIVTAAAEAEGDYESFKRVVSVDGDGGYQLSYTQRQRGVVRTFGRRVLGADARNGRYYKARFWEGDPETIAGSTAIGISRGVFNDLKAGRPVDLRFDYGGSIRTVSIRLASNPVRAVAVLVGDRSVMMPVIDVIGGSGADMVRGLFLDDPANPLMLSLAIGANGEAKVRVVRIDDPKATGATLEQALAGKGARAELPGIYFETAKATLLPQSRAAIDAAGAVLRSNPSWRLAIEGHTDAIGGDAANLGLSRARAEAVLRALAESGFDAGRFTSTGFGESRPRAANDTIEGRAANRRVELVRLQ